MSESNTSSPATIWPFQLHHILPRYVYLNADVRTMLDRVGFGLDMQGNKMGLWSADSTVGVFAQASQAVKNVLFSAGWGINKHSGDHNGYNVFLATQFANIERNLTSDAQKFAVIETFRFAQDISRGAFQGLDLSSNSISLETAWNEHRQTMGWGADFSQATEAQKQDAFQFLDSSFDSMLTDAGAQSGDYGANQAGRKVLAFQLARDMKNAGLLNDKQFSNIIEKLNVDNFGHTTAAVISLGSDLLNNGHIASPADSKATNIERSAAEIYSAVFFVTPIQFERALDLSREFFDALEVIFGKEVVDSYGDVGTDVLEWSKRSQNQLSAGLGGGIVGDVGEFLNVAYDSLKLGFGEDEWAPFWLDVVNFGAAVVYSAALITSTTSAAYRIHPIAGALVAAGWVSYGVIDAISNLSQLAFKISKDLIGAELSNFVFQPLGNLTNSALATIADGILSTYNVGKPLTYNLDLFDDEYGGIYVVDDLEERHPDYITGTDGAEIIFGRNSAVIDGAGGDDEIHFTGNGEIKGGAGNDRLLVFDSTDISVDGGDDNDIILSKDGTGGTFVGGAGRDWIFVKTPGAHIYGDSIDGRSEQESDNFWWWPDTIIRDAEEQDVLKFFGFPLTGGTNNIPLVAAARVGAAFFQPILGGALQKSPLYFDNFLVWMNYMQDTKTGDLYVVNVFDGLAGFFGGFEFQETEDGIDISGAMRVADYTAAASYWGSALATYVANGRTGDLGMIFKDANPYLAALSLLPPILGGTNKVLPLVDEVLFVAAAASLFAKALDWSIGVDPLVLDLDGDGLETVGIDDGDIYFDLDGDFFAERAGWLSGDDGFLALDKNRNGIIDDINELFGGQLDSGLADLGQYDDNGDGVIDQADLIWSELRIWQDRNQDAVSDAEEMSTLDDLGIVSIDLAGAFPIDVVTPQGATLRAETTFTFDHGGTGALLEAIFELNDVDTQYRGDSGLAPWFNDIAINTKGFGRVADLAIAMSNDFDLGNLVAQAAAGMTVPNLKDLRAQSGPVLGAWAYALDLTRELAPVLLSDDGAGTVTLVDRGIYAEDETGGYWTLESSAPILDAGGVEIARATLEDVLAQGAADGNAWRLEQAWSPATRAEAPLTRDPAPYLVEIVEGRAVVLDHGIGQPDGSWALASGTEILDEAGIVIANPTVEDILAMTAAEGQEWRVEEIGFNPYASIKIEHIGVNLIDGVVVDYTVEITDRDGPFYVWARNLDRALELQAKTGTAREFNLRNFEIDFDTLDEVGSTDDSAFRVELLTPGQFHFATSLVGIDFQPQMLSAAIDETDGTIAYTVNDTGETSLSAEEYVSPVDAMIDMVGVVMEEYITVSRAFAVRMALQGGLKDFARGIEYDVADDIYRPVGGRELAPLFEAIFEGAPEGYDAAYDYLSDWNELLWQIYPNYQPDASLNQYGLTAAIDQAYIFQMMLPAWESIPVDVDIRAAMNALSIDESRLIDHDATATDVNGTHGLDLIYMTGGDQTYRGGIGADFYFVGDDFGNDIIYDRDLGANDELRFTSIASTEVDAVRDGQDLLLSFEGRDDTLRINDQFLGELNEMTNQGKRLDTGVNMIVFSDGAIWDRFRMAFEVADPQATNDAYIGSGSADVLWGGEGNDVMRGGLGGDIYVYKPGDGQDVIGDGGGFSVGPMEAGIDVLQFGGDLSSEDLRLYRDGDSEDLRIVLIDEEGTPTGDSILVEGQFGGVRANLEILALIDPSLELDWVSPNMIERFIFADGTSIDFEETMERVLTNAKTEGDDAVYGFLNANEMDGGAGDDYLTGREGGDTYIFGRGYGEDVAEDDDFSFKLFGADPDRLRFIDDLRWTDFDFERDGASDTLTMRITGTEDTITLVDFLERDPFGIIGYFNRIEDIEFGDGTLWSWAKLLQHYIDIEKTTGNDTIYGFHTADLLDGGAGDDRLEGLGGNDTFVFARGYGSDTILSGGGSETLRLDGITAADVVFSRTDLDLIITVTDTGDRVVLENQYVRASEQYNATEFFEFSDQTMVFSDLNPEDLDLVGTSASETLTGSNFAERFDGRAGDDTMIGRDGGDTYEFEVGYGADVIVDRQERAAWKDREGAFVAVDDVVEFGDDITRGNVQFTKDNDDLVVSVEGRTDTLRIRDQFKDIITGVERFEFKDGTFLLISDVEELLQIEGGNRGDNIIEGTPDQPNALDGRQGDDVLIGGTAGDTYAFGSGYDFDRIEERQDSTGVIDRVVFGSTVTQDALKVRRDGDDLQIDLGNGADVLTIKGGLATTRVEEFQFADGTVLSLEDVLDRLLEGSEGDDLLIGFQNRNDVLSGGAGSDALEGRGGDDIYRFGFGDGADSVEDTGGIDRIEFGSGVTRDQVAFDLVGDDLLFTLRQSGETLVVLGGASLGSSQRHVESVVFADGETLDLAGIRSIIRDQRSITGQDRVIASTLDTNVVGGGFGFDTIEMASDTLVVFNSGDGIDRIVLPETITDARIDFQDFVPRQAVVRIAGIESGDLLIAFPDTGDQVVLVGALTQTSLPVIGFSDGTVWSRDDLITQTVAAQTGPENDLVFGTALNDVIEGGKGDDEIRGGAGDDTFRFTRGDGSDVILDTDGSTNTSASRNDTLEIAGYISTQMRVSQPVAGRNELILTFENSDDEITLRYDGQLKGVDTVVFSDATLTREELFARTVGQGTPFGDTLLGTTGADTLEGQQGDDLLEGGRGADTYIFRRGDGSDVIEETYRSFENNVLVLPDHVSGEVKITRLEEGSNDVVMRLGNGDEILLENQLSTSSYDGRIKRIEFRDGSFWIESVIAEKAEAGTVPDDVLTIEGTTGNEALDGTAATEIFDGKGGSDTHVYAKGGGRDYILSYRDLDETVTLEIQGYDIADAVFGSDPQDGENLVIRFPDANDEIVVEKGLGYRAARFSGDGTTYSRSVDFFVFDDGVLNYDQMVARIIGPQVSDGDDTITGTESAETIDAGLGDDIVDSADGDDTIVFERGDGRDILLSTVNDDFDTLRLKGYTPEEVKIGPSTYDSNGYVITFTTSDDRIEVLSRYNDDDETPIHRIEFDGGTTWSRGAIDNRLRDTIAQGTDGDDLLHANSQFLNYGSSRETFDPMGGDDYIVSGVDRTTLTFRRGAGRDTMESVGSSDTYLLDLPDLLPGEIELLASTLGIGSTGTDYALRVLGTDDEIWLENAANSLEKITFSDGSFWEPSHIAANLGIMPVMDGARRIVSVPHETTTLTATSDDETFTESYSGTTGATTYLSARNSGHDVIDETRTGDDAGTVDTVRFSDVASAEIEVRLVPVDSSYDYSDLLITFGEQASSLRIVGGGTSNYQYADRSGIDTVEFSDGISFTLDELTATAVANEAAAPRIVSAPFTVIRGAASGTYYIEATGDDIPLILEGIDPAEVTATRIAEGFVIEVAARESDGSDAVTLQFSEDDLRAARLVFDDGTALSYDYVEALAETASVAGTGERTLVNADTLTRGVDTGLYILSGAGGDQGGGGLLFPSDGEGGIIIVGPPGGFGDPRDPVGDFGQSEPTDLVLAGTTEDDISVFAGATGMFVRIAGTQPDNSDEMIVWIAPGADPDLVSLTLDGGVVLTGRDLLDGLERTVFTGTSGDDHLGTNTLTDGVDDIARQPASFEAGEGDDLVTVRTSDTVIVYNRGDGHDLVLLPVTSSYSEVGPSLTVGTDQKLDLRGIDPATVDIFAHGTDLLIRVAPTDPLAATLDGGSIRFVEGRERLDRIVFDDAAATKWTRVDITDRIGLALGTDGDDAYSDTFGGTRFDLGAGNDYARITGDANVVVYRNGGGFDTIEDMGRDTTDFGQGGPDGPDRPVVIFPEDDVIFPIDGGLDGPLVPVVPIGPAGTVNYDDLLDLPDLLETDVTYTQHLDDFVVQVIADSARGIEAGSITFRDAFIADASANRMVEIIRFADGNEVSVAPLLATLEGDGTPVSDTLSGTNGADLLDGGEGRDLLIGLDGDDTYVWSRGDGSDDVLEDGYSSFRYKDTLRLNGVTQAEASFTKTSRGLLVRIEDSAEGATDGAELLILGQFVEDTYEGTGIERFEFDDGTIDIAAVSNDFLAAEATIFDDRLVGIGADETLEGGRGDDILIGAGGDNTYLYTRGDGYDRVFEDSYSGGTLRLVGIDPATVRLRDGYDGDVDVIITDSAPDAGDAGRVTIRQNRIDEIVFDPEYATVWNRDDFDTLFDRNLPTEGDDRLIGTGAGDTLDAMGGDDYVTGGQGDDLYVYTRGDGRDTIRDEGYGTDTLEITGYARDEVTFARRGYDGLDLVIRLSEAGDEIIVVNAFAEDGADRIETVTLVDEGLPFTLADIRAELLASTATDGDDIVVGTGGDDELTGGKGNDILSGGEGDDVYFYRAGDGDDRISESDEYGFDEIRLPDYDVGDVTYALRAGPGSLDLVLRFAGERDRLIIENALADTGENQVERLVFSDGTIWTPQDMRERAISDVNTAGDDNVYGFDGDEVFEASAGNDFISGAGGSDMYRYRSGDGHDTIEDDDIAAGTLDRIEFLNVVSSEVSVERLFKGSDSVLFSFASSDGGTLKVIDALAEDGRGIERYQFTDGVVWNKADVEALLDNNVPVATDDGYFTATTGEPLVILASTLLRNDFDADNDAVMLLTVDGGENGLAEIDSNGNVVFTPFEDFYGPTRITYKITDGRNGIAEGGVDIRVRPIAEARDDTGFEVAEDGFLTIETERLLSNDLDGDRMIVGQVFGAENGTASLSSNGEVSFTPDADFYGTARFIYVANTPEGGRAEAQVIIDVTGVNDAPTANPDTGFETLEDIAFEIDASALLANDVDIDGDTLTLTSVTPSATLNVELTEDGVVLVTPQPYYFGTASFDYTVEDGNGASATGSVSVNVISVNNAPQPVDDRIEDDDGQPLLEDNPIIVNLDTLLANDIDRDNDALIVTGVDNDFGGTARLLDNGTVLFTPWANFNGEAGFNYTVDDGEGASADARVTLVYEAVNDNPIARDVHYNDLLLLNGLEDQAIEIPISELMKNDYDIEGLALTFESAGNGIDGDVTVTDRGTVIFTPDADYWGEATFNYVVSDPDGAVDDARVTMWFENVGDAPPVANPDEIVLFEDVPTTIPLAVLLANDTDIDRDSIEFAGWRYPTSIIGGDLNGTITTDENGDLLFTPDANRTKSFGFFYTATDNRDGSSEGFVDIRIIAINDEPTAVADDAGSYRIDVPIVLRVSDIMANDFDVDMEDDDTETISFIGVDSVSNGTADVIEANGERFIILRTEPGFAGDLTMQYRIADSAGIEDTGFVTAIVEGAYDGVIEGTPLVDLLIGTAVSETINGLDSSDVIEARAGDDTIDGGLGDDDIDAGAGDDLVFGGDGADGIDGGAGFDTVDFAGSNTGVRADLGSRLGQGGFAQGDIYVDIEALAGTAFRDTLGGDEGANLLDGREGGDRLEGRDGADTLLGRAGDDFLEGGAGADTLDGGEGSDTADYFASTEAVAISLADGTATGGDAEGDTLLSIENVIGTDFDDAITGDAATNRLEGGRGDDDLSGNAGDDFLSGGRGADALDGGEGTDTADYTLSVEGVTVDMADGNAGSGDAEGDTFDSIEIVNRDVRKLKWQYFGV